MKAIKIDRADKILLMDTCRELDIDFEIDMVTGVDCEGFVQTLENIAIFNTVEEANTVMEAMKKAR